jgi:hypothetical protein
VGGKLESFEKRRWGVAKHSNGSFAYFVQEFQKAKQNIETLQILCSGTGFICSHRTNKSQYLHL